MAYQHNTFDRRIQLGASRRRREDAESLHDSCRWAGAIYLGGYAIECSLKALICHNECTNNLKQTKIFREGNQESLHSLTKLLREVPSVKRAVTCDRTDTYRPAWNAVSSLWQKDELRYWDKVGDQQNSQRFIVAMRTIHNFVLRQQGES